MIEGESGFSPEENEQNEQEPTLDAIIEVCRKFFPEKSEVPEEELGFDEWREAIIEESRDRPIEEAIGDIISEFLDNGKIEDPDDFFAWLTENSIQLPEK